LNEFSQRFTGWISRKGAKKTKDTVRHDRNPKKPQWADGRELSSRSAIVLKGRNVPLDRDLRNFVPLCFRAKKQGKKPMTEIETPPVRTPSWRDNKAVLWLVRIGFLLQFYIPAIVCCWVAWVSVPFNASPHDDYAPGFFPVRCPDPDPMGRAVRHFNKDFAITDITFRRSHPWWSRCF